MRAMLCGNRCIWQTVSVCVLNTCAVEIVCRAHVMHEAIFVRIGVVEYFAAGFTYRTADVLEFLMQSFYCSFLGCKFPLKLWYILILDILD